MKEFVISPNEAGQRFDKYLGKLLSGTSMSFVFKMLRKKNFTLNDRKAAGNEILCVGDHVKLFLSDETFDKFSAGRNEIWQDQFPADCSPEVLNRHRLFIVYEDPDILIFNKPAGMLSQKAAAQDVSVNEYLIGYLLQQKKINIEEMATFRPSIANRLDRNTSGLILCGKSLAGLQYLSEIIKNRTLEKYYRCIVSGAMDQSLMIEGYLTKDTVNNQVYISQKPSGDEASWIKTGIDPIGQYTFRGKPYTELQVHLITGKPHQIRAHLSSIGHPVIGDHKYGAGLNCSLTKQCHIRRQLLHAYMVVFPKTEGRFAYLNGKKFVAAFPGDYERARKELLHGNME